MHAQSHARMHAHTQDTEPVTALAVSPDCKTLVAASRSLMLRVYDLQSGQLKRSWRVHKAAVADMAIDASGGYVQKGACMQRLGSGYEHHPN
eukprot:1154560-Pelagomonas_calceolata.AAC.21